ncbi:hypothetical protein [Paenibacillus rigui]|uniref:Pyridoxamine 5'-phosphate oxidase putative domain-containing protein n=1 Tax=Paenibacillus rigui TaxID=554312 RepID=A0A229UGY3_9BACL|nr:hypothetical protein [Paenibacillus rigui]OXM82656.1 hypothetical protein CF651_29825 [Paenibacillus rigui]
MQPYPDELLHFLQRSVPIFIHLAAARPGQIPFSCRGYGFRMESERDVCWIYILRSQWLRMNGAMGARGELAALLTSGIDNESYQLKGELTEYRTMTKEDREALEHQRRMTSIHTPNLVPLLNVSHADCLAVGFRLRAVYVQTPGPGAGSLMAERRLSD